MKIFAGIVGFVGFVVALMAIARFAAAPSSGSAVAVAPTSMSKSSSGPASSPASNAGGQPHGRIVDEDRPLLPPLFVFRDDKTSEPVALAGPRAKPMLLHLWASWCGPCRAELPSLFALGRKGWVDVVAVTVDDRFGDVVRFFGGQLPPEVVWDKTITLERALGVRSIPTTFLVDTSGHVIDRFDGMQPWDDSRLENALREALAASGRGG